MKLPIVLPILLVFFLYVDHVFGANCSFFSDSPPSSANFSGELDPYCHGDFVIDNIRRIVKADNNIHFTFNVFNSDPADAVIEIHDSNGDIVDWYVLPGHRPIPDSLYDLFVQNQINVVKGFTDAYAWNDPRDYRQSRMVADVLK